MRARLGALLVVVVLGGGACRTSRSLSLHELEALRPGQVWVTRTDRTVVIVEGPQIVRNRLAGFVDGVYQVMPVDAVQSITMKRTDPTRTAALLAASAVGIAAAAYMLSGSSGHQDPCSKASSECIDQMP